ncbi:hypothetical protein M2418_004432 [Rhizobium sp. BIGb0125]|nr:hypothetical protein [Rhizobium sp. BIGb0125]
MAMSSDKGKECLQQSAFFHVCDGFRIRENNAGINIWNSVRTNQRRIADSMRFRVCSPQHMVS